MVRRLLLGLSLSMMFIGPCATDLELALGKSINWIGQGPWGPHPLEA